MTKQTVGKVIEAVIAKRSQYQAASGYLGMHTIANTSGTNPAITANTIKLSLRALFISIIRSDCETWKNGLKNPCGDGVSMFYTFELFLQYYLPYFLHLGRQDNSQCYSILICSSNPARSTFLFFLHFIILLMIRLHIYYTLKL